MSKQYLTSRIYFQRTSICCPATHNVKFLGPTTSLGATQEMKGRPSTSETGFHFVALHCFPSSVTDAIDSVPPKFIPWSVIDVDSTEPVYGLGFDRRSRGGWKRTASAEGCSTDWPATTMDRMSSSPYPTGVHNVMLSCVR